MRKIILLMLVSISMSCKSDLNNDIKFKWLAGKWQRIDNQPGNATYENWYLTMNGNYQGHGYTLQQGDTIFQERLSIHPKFKLSNGNEKSWVLQVTGVNESPTIFDITVSTATSFTAVNLKNEFPTHIVYRRVDDSLKAQVYNEEFSIDFTFIKR